VEAPAVVALVLCALAVGAALGAWCAWPRPAPPAPEVLPAPLPAPPAPALPPEPPPAPPPEALVARQRFLDLGRAAAEAWHASPSRNPEVTARLFAALIGDGWALGVGELRAELVAHSALPVEVIDYLTTLALSSLEARQRKRPPLAPWPAWALEARRRDGKPAR
jgi:hypothetical protein